MSEIKFVGVEALSQAIANIKNLINKKQDVLSFDGAPTSSSANPVTSGGIKAYVDDEINGLATVASTGSYNDLANKPTIPTVNNGTVYLYGGSSSNYTAYGSFTRNGSGNNIIYITDATSTTRGLMSAADKAKLDSLVDGDSGLPECTTADAGKFLTVDSTGVPVWTSVPNAEEASF